MLLHIGHQHSQFWPILARFVDYYSLFWGLGVISAINGRRGAFTCPSSTVAILADSGPFRALLLTILGVPKRLPWLSKTKVCLRVGRQDSQFGSILARFLDYYSVLWSRSDFHD